MKEEASQSAPDPRGDQTDGKEPTPAGAGLSHWAALVGPVAVLLALVELLLLLLVYPTAASDGLGLLVLSVQLVALYAAFALPMAVVGWLGEQTGRFSRPPEPSWLLAAVASSVAAAAALILVEDVLVQRADEFPELTRVMRGAAAVVILMAAALLARLLVEPAATWVRRRAPRLGTARVCFVFVLTATALSALAFGHYVLAPVYLVEASRWLGVLACALLLLAARLTAPRFSPRTSRAVLVVISLLLAALPVGLYGNSHARFVLYGHCSTAGPMAALLRNLADIPEAERTARFVCVVAVCTPEGEIHTAEGICEGRITHAPAGQHGFGYDPVFLVLERGGTMAQLPPEEKNRAATR